MIVMIYAFSPQSQYNSETMLVQILVNLLGAVVFLYLFWKRLKDDYTSSFIFSTGFYIILGILLGFFVSNFLAPSWWFWISLAGGAAGFGLGIVRFNLRFFETFEAAALGLLPWLAIFFLSDSVKNSSAFSLGYFLFILALIVFSYLLSRSYKTFTWYKSGKVGFVGLTIASLFFLLRGVIALLFPFVLSFVGRFEVILSGVVSFALFLLLFNLSRYEE